MAKRTALANVSNIYILQFNEMVVLVFFSLKRQVKKLSKTKLGKIKNIYGQIQNHFNFLINSHSFLEVLRFKTH